MQRLVLVAMALSAVMLHGAEARARCCSSQADCPRGISCDGGFCDLRASTCNCDADCPSGLRCLPGAVTQCSGAGSQTCSLVGQCTAGWQIPCSSSADCGLGGFECVPGGGTLCAGSSCQTTTECRAPTLPSPCTVDTDCPAGWTCEPDTAEATKCVPTMRSCPSNGCPALTDRMACRPPNWELVGDNRFAGPPFTPGVCSTVGGGTGGTGGTSGAGGSSSARGGGGGVIAIGGTTQPAVGTGAGGSGGGTAATGGAAGGATTSAASSSNGGETGTIGAGGTTTGAMTSEPSGGAGTFGSVSAPAAGGVGGQGAPASDTGGAGGPRSSSGCSYHSGGRPRALGLALVLLVFGARARRKQSRRQA